MNYDLCEGCPLDGVIEPMGAVGHRDAPYLFVTDTPSEKSAATGKLLSPQAVQLISGNMQRLGFSKRDFAFHPHIKCAHEPTEFTTKERRAIASHCKQHLEDHIKRQRPEVIMPLGAGPASAVIGRAVKIMKIRGVPARSNEHNAMILPMLGPGFVLFYPQNEPSFAADCNTFARLVDHDMDIDKAGEEVVGDYEYIDDLQFLIDADPEIVAYDTETTSLSWFKTGPDVRTYDPDTSTPDFSPRAQILTMQFTIEPGKGYMLPWDHPDAPQSQRAKARLKKQLQQLLCKRGRRVVGQNTKYDCVMTAALTGVRFKIGGDTMMLAALMDENSVKNLDDLTKRYVPDMAGYADCVHPDTFMLMEDLTKKRAGDVVPSDRLVGFEEYANNGTSRKMVPTVVESVRRLRMPSFVIEMMGGQRIQVSGNHQFLKGPVREENGGSWKWVTASSLRVGDRLKLFPFPDQDTTFEAGWMSGILDGEGYVTNAHNAGMKLGFCQLEGAVLSEGMRLFNHGESLQISWDGRKRLANITVSGARSMSELIRLRPRRLIAKKPWEGKALFVGEGTQGRIRSVEYVGYHEVVSIQTSSHTFIANGFATHNCFNLLVDKSRMWTQPLDGTFLDYGCGDTDSTLRLHDHLYREVAKDKRLLAHYERVSLPGLNAFASIEMRGLPINEDEVESFEAFMEESVGRQKQALLKQVAKSIKRKHIDKGLRFSRSDFTLDVLFNHPDGFRLKPKVFTKGTTKLKDESRKTPSTSSKNHLPYFYDECPFTMELAQYIKDDRLLGTNIKGFKKKYIIDGVVRPTYSLAKTVTGRSASENPNGQNFPKRGENATRYRRLFIPPPGHYILEADLSQAELRISADMARDHTMLEIYRNFGDIHTRTALIVMGITQAQFDRLPKAEQKLARFRAKAVNFGFIYGMGWRKFIGYAKTQYGVEFTEKEAQRIRTGFFETYSALPEWHKAMRDYAREHGQVRSYSGRIRHLPTIGSSEEFIQQEAERQAVNSPVQEFASSLGVMAVGRMDDQIDDRYLASVAFVHDAIYCYVPYEYLLWGARTLKWYMESNRIEEWFGIKMHVPIVADVGFGLNMGDTYELKGLAFKGGYDFDQFAYDESDPEQVKAAGGLPSIIVPPQRTPPNNGKRATPLYDYVDRD